MWGTGSKSVIRLGTIRIAGISTFDAGFNLQAFRNGRTLIRSSTTPNFGAIEYLPTVDALGQRSRPELQTLPVVSDGGPDVDRARSISTPSIGDGSR